MSLISRTRYHPSKRKILNENWIETIQQKNVKTSHYRKSIFDLFKINDTFLAYLTMFLPMRGGTLSHLVNSILSFSFSSGSQFTFLPKDSIFRDMMPDAMLNRYDNISAFLTIASLKTACEFNILLMSYVYKSKFIALRLCHWLFHFWPDTWVLSSF